MTEAAFRGAARRVANDLNRLADGTLPATERSRVAAELEHIVEHIERDLWREEIGE